MNGTSERLSEFRAPRMTKLERARWDADDSGRLVRMLREERGLTRSQLAEAAGVPHVEVVRFEAGATIPSEPMLIRLTRALGYHA
ncbi:helix-turn-helix domain-containing protein [Amycolatopsis anabasis]|uniref:helix-turn-helix domain-containing protein n=1 Tax=Amycolatopsis anabasis TaxID=1840409 RepID=UPI001C55162A|nr:helix-turn-helix transcriptional regulator [Amycolatopsis anabasis]